MKTRFFSLLALLCAMLTTSACTDAATEAQVTINIDANRRGADISPTHYGIFFEDINHAADGGLYAELIRNRRFMDDTMQGRGGRRGLRGGAQRVVQQITGWHTVGEAKTSLIDIKRPATANPAQMVEQKAMKLTLSQAGDGVRNEGFWGMNVVEGTTYRLAFILKSAPAWTSMQTKATASLVSKDGTVLGETQVELSLSNGTFAKYTAEITATASDPRAEFQLTFDQIGEVELAFVSLFPPTFKDRENGMRPDLAQMLADMHPRFMRFPGGCFVEGERTPDNAFRWKRTLGPVEDRPGHENVNWGYRTSDGIGFHEYLQLAEDLGAKPLFVVNVGIWHGGCDPYDQIDSWIEECLDALEYANGDQTTKYGKMRAEAGHPEPFGLEYIEIGNENYNFHMDNNSDQSDHYPERYIQFYNAIKAKYPNVKCIGNVESWGTDDPSWRNDYPVDMVDEHYYRNPKWFADRFHKYDTYARDKHKVYVGEYAVTSQFGEIGNLNAALGEAVYMMGMENNSDVVVMNSYAPIFVNENDARWRPDMIRFNADKSMGTPSYYVQQMFPNNIGTQVVKTDLTYDLTLPQHLQEEAVKPVQVGVATWGTQVEYRNAMLETDGQTVNLDAFVRWQVQSGEWVGRDDCYLQTSFAQPAIAVCPIQISGTKYTYTVEAKKTGGTEGFMVVFGYKDGQNFGWFNVGGWQNSRNNIEQTIGGGKIQLAQEKQFRVENDRWYTLRVEVDGDDVRCFIDGEENLTCRLQHTNAMEGVYATTTINDEEKTMYVKVVNVGEGFGDGVINLSNCAAQSATLLTLASESGDDENTLDNPQNIVPTEGKATLLGATTVAFHLQPFSVNIVRINLK